MAEVFGFPIGNVSEQAIRYRKKRLCPFGNKVPNCTKDKAKDPLGVCSVYDDGDVVITCPIRFRQDWIIAEDAADFFFGSEATWTTLAEVRLDDRNGKSAGNIDVVVVAYDNCGRIADFGALEVQAVYISGNVRNPFEHYMRDMQANKSMTWTGPNYPRPDYLSSSRKRLVPQLIFKGGILKAWGKKTAVALNRGFYETLPNLREVPKDKADIAWMIYDLERNEQADIYVLRKHKMVYTEFADSLDRISRTEAGDVNAFVEALQTRIDKKLSNPPDTQTLEAPL